MGAGGAVAILRAAWKATLLQYNDQNTKSREIDSPKGFDCRRISMGKCTTAYSLVVRDDEGIGRQSKGGKQDRPSHLPYCCDFELFMKKVSCVGEKTQKNVERDDEK